MSRRQTKYSPALLLACLAEWDAITGPGSAVRRDKLRIKYGFPNMKTAYVYMSNTRKLRDHTATPAPSPAPAPSPVTNGHGQDIMLEWLIAAERDLSLDRATVDALMGHWCRYQRQTSALRQHSIGE